MKFKYLVRHNGVDYPAGTDVPVEVATPKVEKKPVEETPKVEKKPVEETPKVEKKQETSKKRK